MELNKYIRPRDILRMHHYLTIEIEPKHIPNYDTTYINSAIQKLDPKYQKLLYYKIIVDKAIKEIIAFYKLYARYNLFTYILNDPGEYIRLDIEALPKLYPITLVRAPVPWHTQYTLAKQFAERHYHNGNTVIIKIRDLWLKRFNDLVIVPVEKLHDENNQSINCDVLKMKVKRFCAETRQCLENDWLPSCADVVLKYKKSWHKLIPKHASESVEIVRQFFDTINSLLSLQLRSLVMKSLYVFQGFFKTYSNGNDYENEYYDLCFINMPLITIYLTENVQLQPSLEEVDVMFHECFMDILEVNKELVKIEILLFPGTLIIIKLS